MNATARDAIAQFVRSPLRTRALGSGHINSTFVAGSGDAAVVVQRINERVFTDPDMVVDRLFAVADAVRGAEVHTPEPVRTASGARRYRDPQGGVWRAYRYVPGRAPGRTHDADAARAFGRLARALAVLDPAVTPVAIARFHDLDHRAEQLTAAELGADAARRAAAAAELQQARDLLGAVRALDELDAWARLPARVVHNDAKRVNIIRSNNGLLTIIDLDTVGAGSLLFDIGELVRSAVREDATSSRRPRPLAGRVTAIVRGYVDGWAAPLADAETAALPAAGLVMTLENALRFVTDFLDGDRYFAVSHPDHNLERARVQLALARRQLAELDRLRAACAHVVRSTR